jgi:hypothetical protein
MLMPAGSIKPTASLVKTASDHQGSIGCKTEQYMLKQRTQNCQRDPLKKDSTRLEQARTEKGQENAG